MRTNLCAILQYGNDVRIGEFSMVVPAQHTQVNRWRPQRGCDGALAPTVHAVTWRAIVGVHLLAIRDSGFADWNGYFCIGLICIANACRK
jgi:hypothetical protein